MFYIDILESSGSGFDKYHETLASFDTADKCIKMFKYLADKKAADILRPKDIKEKYNIKKHQKYLYYQVNADQNQAIYDLKEFYGSVIFKSLLN